MEQEQTSVPVGPSGGGREAWTKGLTFDWDAQRRELTALEQALFAATSTDYEGLVVDVNKLSDEMLRAFCGWMNMDYFEARDLIKRVLQGLNAAVWKTDWRLGYGKVRTDATVPEAAATLSIASLELLESAFSQDGMRAYRNRHHAFIEALASYASEANGSAAGNAAFYERLGRRVAREVLDHKLSGPQPKLAPTGADYEDIEIAAVEQLIYFVQVGETGPIKIGIAGHPANRLASLQTGHHETLHMRAITAGGADGEKAYHVRFAEHRLRGEWFSPAPDILAEIERLSQLSSEGLS